MGENMAFPSDNSFKRLLEIIKEKESIDGHQFYIESYCQTTPLFEINSNLLSIEFEKLITIHSKIIPKNVLWSSLVDSRINQIDFKDTLSNDFNSLIIVIKGIPENPTDIINFDVSIGK